jgi:hypothetical protein
MPAPEADATDRNGFRRAVTTITVSVTVTLIVGAVATAVLVWSDQRILTRDVASNRVLIAACCAEGGDTRSDLRNLTTRFDAFLNSLEALLEASERRLQRLEDSQ